jgi:tetratricopeptide (TPR) repeat protein
MGSSSRPDPATIVAPPAPAVPKSHPRRWYAIVAACLALALGGWGIASLRGHDTAQADTTPVQAEPAQSAPAPAPARTTRTVRKPAPPRATSEPTVSNSARARELTTAGYNRLAQRDYQRAHDDFEQALELDPNNASAKRGLQLSQGGETVDTISGILHR